MSKMTRLPGINTTVIILIILVFWDVNEKTFHICRFWSSQYINIISSVILKLCIPLCGLGFTWKELTHICLCVWVIMSQQNSGTPALEWAALLWKRCATDIWSMCLPNPPWATWLLSLVFMVAKSLKMKSKHQILKIAYWNRKWICWEIIIVFSTMPCNTVTSPLLTLLYIEEMADQAPVPLTIFRSNSKFDHNLQCSSLKCTLPTTTKFCTRHDSVTIWN